MVCEFLAATERPKTKEGIVGKGGRKRAEGERWREKEEQKRRIVREEGG